MKRQKNRLRLALVFCLSAASLPSLADDDPGVEAIQEYLEFAEYSDGSISTEQLKEAGQQDVVFIDVRDQAQFDAGHIPHARHIGWRNILERRDEIPQDRPVVLYCDTGLLSSKAHMALRIAGYDNVKVLWGGYLIWSAHERARGL